MKRKWLLWAFAIVLVVSAFSASCLVSGAEGTTPTVSIYAKNLNFDNQIYIRYAVKVESAEAPAASDVGMLIWREDTATRTPETADAVLKAFDKTVDVGGVNCYIFEYDELTAVEMADTVYSQPYVIHNGAEVYGAIEEYSICTYAARMLGLVDGIAGTPKEDLRAMLQDMLHYGAKAQLYFDHNPNRLATDILNGHIKVTYNTKVVMADYDNPNPTTFEVGSGKVKLLPLEAKGYTFKYWMDEDGNQVTEIDTSEPADITLTAIAVPDHYSITYKNTMGVYNPNEDPNGYDYNSYTVLDRIDPQPLEKYDYTFNGWRYDNAYGEFVGEEGIPAGTTGNITLYADWTLKSDFENMLYIVDDEYNLPNGQKFCMLTGVIDSTATKVEISSVFNHIKEGALENCHWLEELSLPYLGSDYTTSNYTNVGYLFGYASNAEAEGAIPTSLRKLTVKSGVIGDYAFANLKTVKEIVLSPEVTSIGYQAFSNLESLEELTMPLLYVNRAKQEAKNGGNGLRSSQYYGLPGSRDISDNTNIEYTGNQFKLHINGGGIYYGAENDLPYEKTGGIIGNGFGEHLFQNCWGISELTIDNITVVPQFAFGKCPNIKKITIGNTVEDIRAGAFFETAIEEIVIPDSVKEWGQSWKDDVGGVSRRFFAASTDVTGSVFDSCESLKKVTIGNGVVNIPTDMFRGCKNLEEVIIGENVRFVDYRAFRNCNDTFEVINHSKQKEWVISNPESERFMTQLMAGENAPEKVYYVHEGNQGFKNEDGKQSVGYFTEEQIKNWHLVFYSPTDPYADGSSTDIEYWYHEDGADWHRKQYTVTPKLWEKPQS